MPGRFQIASFSPSTLELNSVFKSIVFKSRHSAWRAFSNCYVSVIVFGVVGWKIVNREFKQIATAGATTAAVTEKVWGEYVSVVCQILAKRNTKMSET